MLQYVIAGLVLGGIYAIAAAGLVVTHQSTGILNLAFGAIAYFIARLYYFLNTQHHWAILPSGLLSILVAGPALGVLLYFALFQFLRLSSTLVKIVATLGLSVVLPALATVFFGNITIIKAPGLAPQPVKVYKVDGVPVTADQLIVYASVALIVVVGALVLRYSDIGLRVRAMVDSPAMTALSGSNTVSISVGVWAVSVTLAGLTGILAAPIVGLDPGTDTLLMAAAFAAVIAAQLRSLPVAVFVGLLMGIIGGLVVKYLPPASSLTAAVIPSLPFVITVVCLVYQLMRQGRISESAGVGGPLDRAIAVLREVPTENPARRPSRSLGYTPSIVGVAVVAVLPLTLNAYWVSQLTLGVVYAVVLLSYTLVVGEGGMVWLCMVTFAGVGAVTAAQLATNLHWPVLLAVLAGGLLALLIGAAIGLLTIRLGDLYVALVTLTFGLLMDNLVFSRAVFVHDGLGVTLNPPRFVATGRAFFYFALIVFCILAVFIVTIRRSTTGWGLTAVRASDPASKTLGVSILQMKVLVAALGAFVAGVGGSLLAMQNQATALPANYATLLGVVWLAVLVTAGIRSNFAALAAGLFFTVFPALIETYSSLAILGSLPLVVFGLGAIALARNPDGIFAVQARQLRWVLRGRGGRRSAGAPATVKAAREVGGGPSGT
jgi:branched-chain amino acid transport system permease protein